MPECNRCHTPITWTKRAGRNIPLNIDGTDHHCKDGVNIPSTEKLPTQIGKLLMYEGNQAKLMLKDGKEHSYAISTDVLKGWQNAGHLLPADNHPDVWLDFSVDDKGFIRPGAKVAQRPDWAKDLSDPTKGEVKSPFKTGSEVKQERAIDAPGPAAPTNPPAGTETAPQTPPAAPQGQSVNEDAVRELLENITNTDPRVMEYLKEKEPALVKAFVDKMESVLHEVKERKKGPAEDRRMPTDAELLDMVYNYDTYWKGKTLMDISARHDIRHQVEWKNWQECLNLAINFHKMEHPSHAELQKLFTSAVLFHRFIHDRLNKVPLLDEVE